MARRTKEEAQETRNRILDAAEAVFHAKGVAHASLAQVADAAGVTRGAIYHHFEDKADLFEAMMDRVTLPLEDILAAAGSGVAADPLALLKLCTTDVLLRTARDPHLQRVFDIAYHKCEYVGDALAVRERHVASQKECLAKIEKGFKACVAAGSLPKEVNPREAALGALSLVSGLIANWVLEPRSFPLEKHAENLVNTYFRGLGAVTPAAPAPARAASRKSPARSPKAAGKPRPAARKKP